jgi:hypothetical protein
MKIYVLGSNSFIKEMCECEAELKKLGFDGWIHPNYIAYMKGELKEEYHRMNSGESVAVKKENDYIRQHYKHILESDAVLIVNLEKKGIKNYIGGNVLMEMSQAYVNNKKIFFLNDMPTGLSFMDEIEAMSPVCLHGDLNNLRKYA